MSKGATTKIQVKRYERYKRDKIVSHTPLRDKIASDMQDQKSNPGHTMVTPITPDQYPYQI